jgi:hypothetical protein
MRVTTRWLWVSYAIALAITAYLFFFRVADYPLEVDDTLYILDGLATAADFSHFWSNEKLFPGRPGVELLMWLGYLAWGEDTAGYHLLSLFFHWLACLLLARFGFVYGISTTSGALLGGALFMVGIAHFRALVWVSALAYPLALCCVLAALFCLRHWLTYSGTLWLVGVYVFTFYGVLCHAAAASVFLFLST